MQKEWLVQWREKVLEDDSVRMHGTTSTSRNLEVALGFSKCTTDYSDNQQPVLFVYSIRNTSGFCGFRMTDDRFSVYPHEQEYLLMEGFRVFILDVEEGVQIENDTTEVLKKYNGAKVTVVYLQDTGF